MGDDYTTDVYEWAFPDVDSISNDDDGNLSVIENEMDSEVLNQSESLESDNQEVSLISNNEIETIKAELAAKIGILNTIIKKLKYPMSIVDDELIEILLEIIKKVVTKLIHREINSDANLMNQMISELTSLIQTKDGMVTIYTSAQDYQRLNNDNVPPLNLICVDDALKEGDILIKSNTSEVRAMLNERIDNLLRIQYG